MPRTHNPNGRASASEADRIMAKKKAQRGEPAQAAPPAASPVEFDIEWFLALASQHGESSDDGLAAEISDLDDFLTLACRLMPEQARYAFVGDEELTQALAAAGYERRLTRETARGELARTLCRIAWDHGEDEPDHTVGDLHAFLEVAWKHLGPEGQRAFVRDEEIVNYLVAEFDIDLCPSIDMVGEDDWQLACRTFGLDESGDYSDDEMIDYANAALLMSVLPEDFNAAKPLYRTPLDERARG